MSASNLESDWNFRIVENRLVTVKTKTEDARKIAVEDAQTRLIFTVDATPSVDIQRIQANKQYLFALNVYTAKNLQDVDKDFLGFFEAVDIDQEMDDFIKAYHVYPAKIRFELVEVMEP